MCTSPEGIENPSMKLMELTKINIEKGGKLKRHVSVSWNEKRRKMICCWKKGKVKKIKRTIQVYEGRRESEWKRRGRMGPDVLHANHKVDLDIFLFTTL